MKIVFHERYREVYSSDPASAQGRLDGIYNELKPYYSFVEPDPASEEDLLLVHTEEHLQKIKQRSHLYQIATLATGGAIKASEIALNEEPAFALIRPPGHHASPSSCWGFCWFNNIAIAIERLKKSGKINTALIIDIDLHFGDGTNGFFSSDSQVTYYHLESIPELEHFLTRIDKCDLVGISAGFDRHVEDWGGLLTTNDYLTIGEKIRDLTDKLCKNKIFAVLEGGYNHKVLGQNVKSLLDGLESK